MIRRNIGLATIASGVVLFLFGLYGVIGEEFSFLLAGAGVLVLLAGLSVFLLALGQITLSRPHPYMIVPIAIAIALHSYEQIGKSSGGFSLGWWLWSLTPYALCLLVSSFPATRIAALAGVVIALAFDLIAHYEVFVNPKGSTAALLCSLCHCGTQSCFLRWRSLSPGSFFASALVWITMRPNPAIKADARRSGVRHSP